MDKAKEAFQKIREDINLLKKDVYILAKKMINLSEKVETLSSTDRSQISTLPTDSSTDKHSLEALKPLNIPVSIGNRGVPTDRQTDRQTDQQTQNKGDSFKNATEILNSLDNIKKEIRLKFKRLTEQELLVFSTLYQIEEEKGHSEYKDLSERLKLSESSIRDYIGRLIKKGIPVDKKKMNNKNIHLFISPNLRKIATLSTILHLRDL